MTPEEKRKTTVSFLSYCTRFHLITLLIFISVCFMLVLDFLAIGTVQDFREKFWSPVIEHYVALGTFVAAFAAWFGYIRQSWKGRLPKRLSVYFSLDDEIVMQCNYAYLSGESDIRQMGQQVGAQISGSRLEFNIADVRWKEVRTVFSSSQIHNCDTTYFDDAIPFRHYVVHYELASLPSTLKSNFNYSWLPPFDTQTGDDVPPLDRGGNPITLRWNRKTTAASDAEFWSTVARNNGYFGHDTGENNENN